MGCESMVSNSRSSIVEEWMTQRVTCMTSLYLQYQAVFTLSLGK